MGKLLRTLIWIAAACAVFPATAHPWIELKSPQFDLYTTASAGDAQAALTRFEQVRRFFLATAPFPRTLESPVRIVIFDGASQYDPYRLNNASSAYFSHRDDGDFIVMQDLEPDHYRAAVHEYAHLVLSRSGVRLPLWMNEGWADLNSTLKPKGKKAMVGEILPGRRETLLRGLWIPLPTLDRIDQRSPLYNEREGAGMFYAESWALMHMLFLSPDYSEQFAAFVTARGKGMALPEACEQVLGKSVAKVESDLHEYFGRNRFYGAVFDVDLTSVSESVQPRALPDLEVELLKADLLVLSRHAPEARAAYEQIERQTPGRPDVATGLAKAALLAGDRPAAMRALQLAMERGTNDPVACYRLAMLSRESGPDRTLTIQALRRALALKSDYTAARVQLGIALLDTQDFAGSLQELQRIPSITEDIAAWYFAAAAYDNIQLGNMTRARQDAESGKKWVKTDAEKDQLNRILRALDSVKTP